MLRMLGLYLAFNLFTWYLTIIKHEIIQYSQRGTLINPLTPVVRIIHARSNTAAEHPLTLVVTRDHRGQRFFIVYFVHVNCKK